MDLFSHGAHSNSDPLTPLAEKLRPSDLNNFLGQKSFLNQNSWLAKAIEKDQCPSLILWGPPGSGKTTLARIVAKRTIKEFIQLNAIATGAKELKEVCEGAKNRRRLYQKGTILFVDEIHRLNKSQQDVFLPYLESGDITLIGATTENPSFEVNSALLSRSRVVVFEKHGEDVLKTLIQKALDLLGHAVALNEDAQNYLIEISDGDARRLLNRVEEISKFMEVNPHENMDREFLKANLGSLSLYHDKKGDSHYDTISAFIKCIRGSDPDAGLYYLARLIESGEDPIFIARRLVILASEDIGNAEPRALEVAMNGFRAVEVIGLPECAINLAQVVVFLASSPKSNASYLGFKLAQSEVRKSGNLPIPKDVRNAPTDLMKNLGYGQNYNNAHDGSRGWLPQQYLPDEIKDKKFYESKGTGFEKKMNEYLSWLKGLLNQSSKDDSPEKDK